MILATMMESRTSSKRFMSCTSSHPKPDLSHQSPGADPAQTSCASLAPAPTSRAASEAMPHVVRFSTDDAHCFRSTATQIQTAAATTSQILTPAAPTLFRSCHEELSQELIKYRDRGGAVKQPESEAKVDEIGSLGDFVVKHESPHS